MTQGLNAQKIQFEAIPNNLGLSQNYISALHQDKQGYLWVGTKDGLNRFDGNNFIVYQNDPFDSTSISGNYVKSIYEDTNGRIWIGTTKGLNIFDRLNKSFIKIPSELTIKTNSNAIISKKNVLSDKDISHITEDKQGNIWLGTQHGGVNKIKILKGQQNQDSFSITHFRATQFQNSLFEDTVKRIVVDQYDQIWVHNSKTLNLISSTDTDSYQIKRMDFHQDLNPKWKRHKTEDFKYNYLGSDIIDERIHSIFLGPKNNLWIKVAAGFAKWNASTHQFKFFHIDHDLKEFKFNPMRSASGDAIFDENGQIWITGLGGFVVYDTLQNRIIHRKQKLEEKVKYGIPNIGLTKIIKDHAGNYWLGTSGYGLYKYKKQIDKFNNESGYTIANKSVRAIHETNDNDIWITTSNLEIVKWNRKKDIINPVIIDNSILGHDIKTQIDYIFSLDQDNEGDLWLAGERGLFKFELDEKSNITDWRFFEIFQNQTEGLPCNVLDIYIDKHDNIWLLTQYEFGKFNKETGLFYGENYLEVYGGNRIEINFPCIEQESDSIFWLGTSEGILKYNTTHKDFIHIKSNPNSKNTLSQDHIKSLYINNENDNKILWIGTAGGGLNKMNLNTNEIIHYKKKDGLIDNVVYGILEDEEGNLWLSTNKGLSCFNIEKETFENYNANNGLQDNEFNSNAYFKNKKGELFFGGIKGMNIFDPKNITKSKYQPQVVITDFKISDKNKGFISNPNFKPNQDVTLPYLNNFFSLNFCALDLTSPKDNQYAYRLKGFNEDWQYIQNDRVATYTNLKPGKYTFEAKGTNYDGIWSKKIAQLGITILPPWWLTLWAKVLFIVLALLIATIIHRSLLHKKLIQAESSKLKELNFMKTKLYTNITHEFRTPLTVIMGMIDNLSDLCLKSSKDTNESFVIESGFNLIEKNSKNLLRLINQILDISKLDNGAMKLNLIQADIIKHLKYLTDSFNSMAEEKDIKLVFYSEIKSQHMDFDEWKIQHIMFNLLSNAIKFTNHYGKIIVHINANELQNKSSLIIKVSDNGIGINPDKIENIFDIFYQVDSSTTRQNEGTGIGLSLTKDLVQLMNGTISVNSELNQGSSFIIELPISNTAKKKNLIEKPIAPLNSDTNTKNFLVPVLKKTSTSEKAQLKKEIILIIEDNSDVSQFISVILSDKYECHFAMNGEEGISMAFELVPHLIISDVMMPITDGYQVVTRLKQDDKTSHIPIILLTAKASEESKIKGFELGADAYIIKPFNKNELIVRTKKLLELGSKLKNKKTSDSVQNTFLESTFLSKLEIFIEHNISNSELDASHLSKEVNLSQAQLYRKFKAISTYTPKQFINKVRLKKALILLKDSTLTISEIAYRLGFNNPNYFTRAFNKEYGKSPRNFR